MLSQPLAFDNIADIFRLKTTAETEIILTRGTVAMT